MAHYPTEVVFKDGFRLYGRYYGTSELMLATLYETAEEVPLSHGNSDLKKCKCEGEDCILVINEGKFDIWKGLACRVHHKFLGPIFPDDKSFFKGKEFDILSAIRLWGRFRNSESFMRESRPTLSTAFKPLFLELFRNVMGREPSDYEMDPKEGIIVWIE